MEGRRYQPFSKNTITSSEIASQLSPDTLEAIRVVGAVLPFRTNSYVVEDLINWEEVPNDPMFRLNFPQRDMLSEKHYDQMKNALDIGIPALVEETANKIRTELNPHPAGQLEHNVPQFDGERFTGVQHKYDETVLFFPKEGQTCHAYCTFCFRWPQFVGLPDLKMASDDGERLASYLRQNPQASDVLITGGDPMVMKAKVFEKYIEPLLEVDSLKNIRVGTKSLSYHPYRYTTDNDAQEMLDIFRRINESGKQANFMAHINHPVELSTGVVRQAVENIQNTGTVIRAQSPIMQHINDKPDVWAQMWRDEVNMGIIPYYMFMARDTGAQDYFAVPMVQAVDIYREAVMQVSGLARTARGPVMSCDPGKVQVLGATEVAGERVIALTMLQGRNPDWVGKPFFAKYDPEAIWMNELKPAFGETEFFYEPELREMFQQHQ